MPNERRTRSAWDSHTESEKIYDTLLASFISITINQDMAAGPESKTGGAGRKAVAYTDSPEPTPTPARKTPAHTHSEIRTH